MKIQDENNDTESFDVREFEVEGLKVSFIGEVSQLDPNESWNPYCFRTDI